MIRWALIGALITAAAPAAADSCSLMLSKDDLPNCVKELESKIFILRAELEAERSRINLYGSIACNLALLIDKNASSADSVATVEAACAEMKERLALKKRKTAKAKSTSK